ncbi:tricarballylate utilization 4Fe-4S protein TcuB [Neisseria animalis]|uniref:Tricarballylate utilization 4Fe-4S protein TcuB n=1 Tax=Neisseria animalis TaxID=492 RepID=A0A5P3MSI9_NEIAN|nr:tricarballylate utilization 4Fe-4S protein TcuB [Neisseria animalis]QEY23609.1 tricarballylate utilization 4Fe-4S protein TcuB [Neisseria animalis]ROW32753.1 tricarballylate utilization 4Fe-4S protein TcuB [Neisseria animalis]VEE09327.1 tricarballylate utilization protein B [Neisseria animalis]
MQTLQELTRQAQALANGEHVPLSADEQEAARVLNICNGCRYCEGFCAVFPAMTRRLEFGKADVNYLANLCHNCGACLHSCQYAPPHSFAISIPQTMAAVRGQTYQEYSWPRPLGKLYRRNGLTLTLAAFAALSLFLILAVGLGGQGWDALWGAVDFGGNFYNLFPHNLMVGLFAPVFLFSLVALAMGVRQFWRDITPVTGGTPVPPPAAAEAAHNVLSLKYLDGGHGAGCNNEDDAFTLARRRCHHFTFYGFMLCFAATALGTVYHYLFGWSAPYDLPSIPKILGAAGGTLMIIGTAGLWRLHTRRHPEHVLAQQKAMDRGFIALLFIIAATGIILWLTRGTPALALMLCLHLAAVMTFFLTMPYSKFAHGFYRSAALLRHNTEKRLPNPVGLGSE